MKLYVSIIMLSCINLIYAQSIEFPYWLEGTWEISTNMGKSYQKWEKINNNLLKGTTYNILNNDTLIFDVVKIKKQDNKIVLNMVANIKKTKVLADYTLSKPTPELFKFENTVIKSPHVIYYLHYEPDKVYVWIESLNSKDSCVDFEMKRINE